MSFEQFVGRAVPLARLGSLFEQVRETESGLLLTVRGRRQVGKSRLISEFCERSGAPYLYFTGRRGADTGRQLDAVSQSASDARTPLQGADALTSPARSWAVAFRQLAVAVGKTPSIVVLDEFPWAAEADPALEAELQVAWDDTLGRSPVMVVLVGSDVTVMERLTGRDRPLYGRGLELVVGPFNPAEVASAAGIPPVDALDTYLVTGGYPRLVSACRKTTAERFVRDQLSDDASPLIITGQRALDAEFPPQAQARAVLSAIGSDQRSFAAITNSLGGEVASGPLTRSLRLLTDTKGVVAGELPAGAAPSSKLRRYRVADSYLRFWLRFIEPQLDNISRGRADLATKSFTDGWLSWRGRAIEPVVHEALYRLAPDDPVLQRLSSVGAWWTRTGTEVDIVATASKGAAILAVGSIKWRARHAFDRSDLAELTQARTVIPNAATADLIAVSAVEPAVSVRSELARVYLPDHLMTAWT